jgi:tRNA (cytidine/uridine-2'-O-)-methyltransferase
MIRLALYQPDIPQNAGTMVRLAACLGVEIDIIEPCGFDASDRNFRRAGMDYIERATISRHDDWTAFANWRRSDNRRLLLATTKGGINYTNITYQPDDIILMGRESAGVPDYIHADADARLLIPVRQGLRSINVSLAAAMFVGEALRQCGHFPDGAVQPTTDQHG